MKQEGEGKGKRSLSRGQPIDTYDQHAPGHRGKLRLGLIRGKRGAETNHDELAMMARTRELRSWGMSIPRVAERLNEEGFRTREGKEFCAVSLKRRIQRDRRRRRALTSDYRPSEASAAKLAMLDHEERLFDELSKRAW